ncbi:Clp protease [Pseudofrankia sp. EUN1h]|nr:Clp protease [Pseudofrankia sp. EUN1h]
MGAEHLLLGLVHEETGPGGVTLASFGLTLADARSAVAAAVGTGAPKAPSHIPFTPRAKHVLETSLRESLQLRHAHVDSGHLLLGLLSEQEGVAADILDHVGIDRAEGRRRALAAIDAAGEIPPPPEAVPQSRSAIDGANMRARNLAAELSQARAAKDAALDAGDFATATAMRQREKVLIAERDRMATDLRTDGRT